MKKIIVLLMALTALLFVNIPSHEALDHTYQTSLWTYPESGRSIETLRRPPQLAVRIGGTTARGSLMRWHRVRLGFPFKAVTLDIQKGKSIVQSRFELVYFVANLFGGLSVGFVISCLLQGVLTRRRFGSRHGPASLHKETESGPRE